MTTANTVVTQFPGGIGQHNDASLLARVLGSFPNLDSVVFDDFDQSSNFDNVWAAAAQGAGATAAAVAAANGIRTYTTAGADNDGVEVQANVFATDGFATELGKAAFFAARFQVDDGLESDLIFGFFPDGFSGTVVDGFGLLKADGDRDMGVAAADGSGAGGAGGESVGDIEDDTWYIATCYWDGVENFSGQLIGPDGSQAGGGTFVNPSPNALPSVGLEPTIYFIAGEAAAKVLTLDWVVYGGGR